jgi:hypothetical protein
VTMSQLKICASLCSAIAHSSTVFSQSKSCHDAAV